MNIQKYFEKKDFEKLGNMAFDLIADYPLYASCDGITYEDGIAIAEIIFGDIKKAWKEQQDFNEYLKIINF